MRHFDHTVLASALALVASGVVPAEVRYVDEVAPAGGDGVGWTTAYGHLQDAMQAAWADAAITEIRVAGGTYWPDRDSTGLVTPGDRAATFQLRSGLALRGGYRGAFSGGDPDQRDLASWPSVLSGDLLGDDEPLWVNHGENSSTIVTADQVDAAAVLDGFVVEGGYAAGPGAFSNTGAALAVDGGAPSIMSCRFQGNLASWGAAVVVFGGAPAFSDCTFSGNYAWTGRGGALYCASGSEVTLAGCTFAGNSSYGGSSVGDGGAIFLEFECPTTISRCVFVNNTASAQMVNFAVGGAIAGLTDGISVVDCMFLGNHGQVGGAVWSGGNIDFVNCVFSGNSALVGGGVALFTATGTFTGCTLSANAGDDGGGISAAYGSLIDIRDSVLWGNVASNAPSLYKAAVHKDESSDAAISYSCVQGVFTPEPGEDPPDPSDFPGCTEADPLLADANGADNVAGTLDDDLHLLPGSPCTDAGDNAAFPVAITTDLGGQPRFADDPAVEDSGLGSPPIVDMGAYERQPPTIPGDTNADGQVDVNDLVAVILGWGPCPAPPAACPADVDGDGQVSVTDLVMVVMNWSM